MASSIFERDSVKAVPLVAIFYLLLKAYVIGEYSLTTAGALVVAAPLTVLVGTITSYLNLALLMIALWATTWLWRQRESTSEGTSSADAKTLNAFVFGLLLTCILFLPWPFSVTYFQEAILSALWYVFGTAAAVLLLWGLLLGLRRKGKHLWLAGLSTPGRIAALYAVILLLPTLDRPWVPAEVLVLRSAIAIQDSHLEDGELRRSKYPVVYVLSESSSWTTVLDAESRILLRLPTDEVAHRQVCRYQDQPPGSVPIWAYISGFRYDSPNTMCHTLVDEHELLLDPLVTAARPE